MTFLAMNRPDNTSSPGATVAYGTQAGIGGLGLQAASAIAGLATAGRITAIGPGLSTVWPLETPPPPGIRWDPLPEWRASWFGRHILRRVRPGRVVFSHDRHIGRSIPDRLSTRRPDLVYSFTQIALEALEWARANGTPTVLDNPNGHIRGFAGVYRVEWNKWFGGSYPGHPTEEMVARVEQEYQLADRIRVSSEWAKQSMIQHGIDRDKIIVCPQPVNRLQFRPPLHRPTASGPLRVCCVGSLDLRKGFVYLLRAVRLLGSARIRVEFVGSTGDRGSRQLFARESVGLDVIANPGDPIPAYHRAEVLVLPSLEDGFGFVTAEAMACGLPGAGDGSVRVGGMDPVRSNGVGDARWRRWGDRGSARPRSFPADGVGRDGEGSPSRP